MGVIDVKDAVKTALTGSTDLADVAKWFGAEPAPTAYPAGCFGWVEWAGGAETYESMDNLHKIVDEFRIVIVTKHLDADVAETDGLTLMEAAEAALKADPTLGAAVQGLGIRLREKQKEFDGKFSLNAIRITLSTWRWVQ